MHAPYRLPLTAAVALFALASGPAAACDEPVAPCGEAAASSFRLIVGGRAARVVVDIGADSAVRDAARGFAGDLAKIGGGATQPVLVTPAGGGDIVVIGVLGESAIIDRMAASGRIRADDLSGRWEAFRQIVVDHPLPGVRRALVIVGADRRGAVFGTYDLSEKAGVSPWAWWADVPVRRRANLWVTGGERGDAPKVRYRGIFINDEDPAFNTWARKRYGGVNAAMYANVFDLILRLKGNYLWPAMWGKSIGRDDPASMPLADAKGVVLGTSHHEPMTRAQAEWHPAPAGTAVAPWDRPGNGGGDAAAVIGGKWDYTTNAANLRAFWRGGLERMVTAGARGRPMEQLVTIGMRGDGDEPMSDGTATELLERIVGDQRRLIAQATGRPAEQTPQVWALYKEVQDYYDKGMRVPDDVTLLFSDDNWGQVRRLPTGGEDRAGGYGVYYHFDYVGGPRSYKWLANTQVEKVWQQMDLSYRRGARHLWVVNVGDLKPMEMPIDFFLKMAWDPEAMTPAALAAYPREWARAAFDERLAEAAGEIVSDYARLAARRKPELIDASSFPLGAIGPEALDGGEFGALVAEWEALERRTAAAGAAVPPEARDAWFQLVEYPVLAMTNIYRLWYAVAWNRALADRADPRANTFATRAEAAFGRDRELRDVYHRLNGGKWDGMMLQTKLGYTNWRDPEVDVLPELRRVGGGGAAAVAFAAPAAPAFSNAVAAEAGRFVRAHGGGGLAWRTIPRLGRTEGAVGAFPQGRPATTIADDVRLDYALTLPRAGDATVRLYMVPALDTTGGGGMRIGVSVDDRPVQTLTLNLTVDGRSWEGAVRDNAAILEARFPDLPAGPHTVKLWRIDDNMLVQKIVLYTGALPTTYLGPPGARQLDPAP